MIPYEKYLFIQDEGKPLAQLTVLAQSSYSNREEGKNQKGTDLIPLHSPKIIRSSPDAETTISISPPPLKPNMAHKARYCKNIKISEMSYQGVWHHDLLLLI